MDEQQLREVFEVNIVDTFGKKHEYQPQDDMTGKEAAHCAHALLTASMMRLHGINLPLWTYVTDNKLERHFPVKVEIALA